MKAFHPASISEGRSSAASIAAARFPSNTFAIIGPHNSDLLKLLLPSWAK